MEFDSKLSMLVVSLCCVELYVDFLWCWNVLRGVEIVRTSGEEKKWWTERLCLNVRNPNGRKTRSWRLIWWFQGRKAGSSVNLLEERITREILRSEMRYFQSSKRNCEETMRITITQSPTDTMCASWKINFCMSWKCSDERQESVYIVKTEGEEIPKVSEQHRLWSSLRRWELRMCRY